jgi:hypothetical protein
MLALQVMELLGIPLPEDRWIPIPRQTATIEDDGFAAQRNQAA